jgi:hypothetical protein
MRKKKIVGAQVRAPAVRLDASAEVDGAKWLEVAYEGSFKGHWMGEFEFTRATFDQIVRNFHAHPQYKAGAESAAPDVIATGAFDVVQWDMHHASEAPATSGEIPVIGAPAQGWALDVRVGQRADGKACLEAYTRWLEPARSYIKEGRYRWASVAVVFDAKDPTSGKPCGAVLTSIAITNQPFLQELPALAASATQLRWYPGDCCRTSEEALEAIRDVLGMPATATAQEVGVEVAKLRGFAAPGTTPPAGVDVDELVGKFRMILALPVLSTPDEVFAELDKLFSQINAPAGATKQDNNTMTTQATVQQPAAKSPAEDLVDTLRITLAKQRGEKPDQITYTQILAAVESGAGATTDLAALLAGLDVKNIAAALEQIGNLKKVQQKLNEIMPQYEAAQKQIDEMDQQAAGEEVDMALASLGFDPADQTKAPVRASLLQHRKSNKDEFQKQYQIAERRAAAKRETALASANAGAGLDITQPLATQRQNGSLLDGVRLGAGGTVMRQPMQQDKPGQRAQRVDLSAFEGRNEVERAIAYLRAQPGGDKLDFDTVHIKACQLLRSQAA